MTLGWRRAGANPVPTNDTRAGSNVPLRPVRRPCGSRSSLLEGAVAQVGEPDIIDGSGRRRGCAFEEKPTQAPEILILADQLPHIVAAGARAHGIKIAVLVNIGKPLAWSRCVNSEPSDALPRPPSCLRRRPGPRWWTLAMCVACRFLCHPYWAPAFAGEARRGQHKLARGSDLTHIAPGRLARSFRRSRLVFGRVRVLSAGRCERGAIH